MCATGFRCNIVFCYRHCFANMGLLLSVSFFSVLILAMCLCAVYSSYIPDDLASSGERRPNSTSDLITIPEMYIDLLASDSSIMVPNITRDINNKSVIDSAIDLQASEDDLMSSESGTSLISLVPVYQSEISKETRLGPAFTYDMGDSFSDMHLSDNAPKKWKKMSSRADRMDSSDSTFRSDHGALAYARASNPAFDAINNHKERPDLIGKRSSPYPMATRANNEYGHFEDDDEERSISAASSITSQEAGKDESSDVIMPSTGYEHHSTISHSRPQLYGHQTSKFTDTLEDRGFSDVSDYDHRSDFDRRQYDRGQDYSRDASSGLKEEKSYGKDQYDSREPDHDDTNRRYHHTLRPEYSHDHYNHDYSNNEPQEYEDHDYEKYSRKPLFQKTGGTRGRSPGQGRGRFSPSSDFHLNQPVDYNGIELPTGYVPDSHLHAPELHSYSTSLNHARPFSPYRSRRRFQHPRPQYDMLNRMQRLNRLQNGEDVYMGAPRPFRGPGYRYFANSNPFVMGPYLSMGSRPAVSHLGYVPPRPFPYRPPNYMSRYRPNSYHNLLASGSNFKPRLPMMHTSIGPAMGPGMPLTPMSSFVSSYHLKHPQVPPFRPMMY